jgi:bacillithiol system protein YtxJ
VEHQSPQALFVRDGKVVWHASHGGITRKALAAAAQRVP